MGPKEEASHGACSQAEGGGGLPRPIRGSEQQPFATMSMFDEMKHAVHNVFKASVESVTSVSHVSQFRQVIPHTCRHAHVSAALRARCGRAAGAPRMIGSSPARNTRGDSVTGLGCPRTFVCVARVPCVRVIAGSGSFERA